jgi:hypothetical protein
MAGVTMWRVGLVVVALVAVALRLPGLGYGLPAVYNPDETAILNRALALGTGQLNPGNFVYPSFYFYALLVWEALSFVAGLATGVFQSLADFRRAYFVDPSWHYLAGRILTLVCGVATVLLTARLGAGLYDRAVGLVAALFLAVAPFAVRDAHYIKHDVPVTLLVVLTLIAAASLVMRPDRRPSAVGWLVAGGLAGLAASTHYYAVFVVLAVAAAALAGLPGERWRLRVRHVAIAAAAAVTLFALGSPFLVLDRATAWADIAANRAIVMDRAMASAGRFGSAGRYAEMLAFEASGWPVFLLGAIGVGLAIADDWRRALVWLAFPAVFLAFLANTVPAGRYLNPILPILALAAAYAVRRTAAAFSRPAAVAVALSVLAVLPAAAASARIGSFFRQTDTRTLARGLIQREVPPGAVILIQPYSVALRPSRESLVRALRTHLGSETLASPRFRVQLELTPYPEPAYDVFWLGEGGLDKDKIYVAPSEFTAIGSLAPIRERNIQYVVLNQERGTNPAFRDLERALGAEATLVGRLVPWDDPENEQEERPEPFLHNTDRTIDERLERPGPVVELWKVR